jgi:hypothetical protein
VSSPPLKKDIAIHLNGMCLQLVDQYNQKKEDLDKKIFKYNTKTIVSEIVSDLVRSIKEDEPVRPDMDDPSVFKFYFELYNKEYK